MNILHRTPMAHRALSVSATGGGYLATGGLIAVLTGVWSSWLPALAAVAAIALMAVEPMLHKRLDRREAVRHFRAAHGPIDGWSADEHTVYQDLLAAAHPRRPAWLRRIARG